MSHIFSLRRAAWHSHTTGRAPTSESKLASRSSAAPRCGYPSALVVGMGTSGERVRAHVRLRLSDRSPRRQGARQGSRARPRGCVSRQTPPRSPPRLAPRHELATPSIVRRRSRAQGPARYTASASGPATTGRRSAALGLGAAFIAGFSAAGKAVGVPDRDGRRASSCPERSPERLRDTFSPAPRTPPRLRRLEVRFAEKIHRARARRRRRNPKPRISARRQPPPPPWRCPTRRALAAAP